MIISAIRDIVKKYSTRKRSAFTVAEVLIALVVLGVIASAVTGVVYFSKNGEFKNRDLVATLQSQVIKLNRSYKIALTENDDLDRWVFKEANGSLTKMSTQSTSAQQNNMFAKVWKTYASTTKDCGATTNGDCFPASTLNASNGNSKNYNNDADYYKMRTADGASIAIKVSDPLCRGTGATSRDRGVCGEIIVDVNGNKGPNKAGLDTFRLGIFHDGIRAFNAGCNDPLNSAGVVLTSGAPCSEDMNAKVCPKDAPQKCYNCKGEIVCVADEKACTTLQKQEGCAKETCAKGTVSYYIDGKVQCIPEAQKECYEKIKINPEFKWDAEKKVCLEPKDNCTKYGGYWDAEKGICWDSPEHMCQTKQMVYISKPNQTPDFECITQEAYCKRAIKDGGLGGWLWKNNVCCTATSAKANTNATCCNAYNVKDGSAKTWWNGTSACCTSEDTEACCKSNENGHTAGFWSGGKCWKNPETQCTKSKSEGGLGGIWIPSTNSCCTTKIVDDVNNPKYCFASEKDKCNAATDKGGRGGWYVASADKCCINATDDKVCCKGIWRSANGKNYCYSNEKDVCLAPTGSAGKGGWWVPEATSYDEFAGCCTSTGSRECCNGKDKNHWWASASSSCCTGTIETTKACCESADNGHESKYWTSKPSQCWTSASQYCITASGSNGLGGWNWIGDAKTGVCCTDTSKSTRSNDSGNGEIRHQGQYDRQLSDTESKACCINESTLNGHSRFIWYTNNYKGNTGYCWDTINNLCQQQTDGSDDHGLGGWYWDGTDCCSINTTVSSISYSTKGNIKANPPTLESTATVSVKNQSNRSTKSCCTNTNSKGGHTRFNWTDKNYQNKGGYCWLNDEELCQSQTANTGNDNGMGGWAWDSSTKRCCTSKYDTSIKSANSSQQVFRKGATTEQVAAYNQQNDSNEFCCTNSNTKGGHTRFIWTSNNYASSGGYCWLTNAELCQAQTDATSTYGKDYGMGGWLWDSANNVCCTIKTESNIDVKTKGGTKATVTVKNQSSNSNKNCCTNTGTKGGHDRFNWTDSTKVSGSKGYCWKNDEELCKNQINGMGGWYWDSTASTCCTIKYGEEGSTTKQTVYRKGATSAEVATKNQKGASSKACCTNSSGLAGHTRFIWTDNNFKGKGGYCWISDAELCTDKTYGMGGWLWDSGNKTCCTIRYSSEYHPSGQTVYRKGGTEDTVSTANQSGASNKTCCTSSNTSGDHSRRIWIDNNYAGKGGYCWDSLSHMCTEKTGNATDNGLGGWLWDSENNVCCTINTKENQTVYNGSTTASTVTVKNQSSNSNKNCCTSTATKGGHDRKFWSSTTGSNTAGYCWKDKSEYCKSALAGKGLGGWEYLEKGDICCTDNTTTDSRYYDGSKYVKMDRKNQDTSSSEACCTSTGTGNGHTRFNWINSRCWASQSDYCTTATKDSGAGGYHLDGTTCCTTNKTANGTVTAKGKGGTSTTITFKNNSDTSTENCCKKYDGNKTRILWMNNKCWETDNGTGKTESDAFCKSSGSGASGWYNYDSGSSHYCCTTSKTGTLKGKLNGTDYTVTYIDQHSTKTCCENLSGTNWYSTSNETKGSCCTNESTQLCCEAPTRASHHTKGTWVAKGTHTADANVCCHSSTESDVCCKALKGDNYWLTSDGKACVNDNVSKEACTSPYHPNGACSWKDGANLCCCTAQASSACCSFLKPSWYWIDEKCQDCVDDSTKANCESTTNCTYKKGGGQGKWVPKGSPMTEATPSVTLPSPYSGYSNTSCKTMFESLLSSGAIERVNSKNTSAACSSQLSVTSQINSDYSSYSNAKYYNAVVTKRSLTSAISSKAIYKDPCHLCQVLSGKISNDGEKVSLAYFKNDNSQLLAYNRYAKNYTPLPIFRGQSANAALSITDTDGCACVDDDCRYTSCSTGNTTVECYLSISATGSYVTATYGNYSAGKTYTFTSSTGYCEAAYPQREFSLICNSGSTAGIIASGNCTATVTDGIGLDSSSISGYINFTNSSASCNISMVCSSGNLIDITSSDYGSIDDKYNFISNGSDQRVSYLIGNGKLGGGSTSTGTTTDVCCHDKNASAICCAYLCPSGASCSYTSSNTCSVTYCNNLTVATNPGASAVTVSTSGACLLPNATVSVTATPKENYIFTGWTVSGGCTVSSSTDTNITVTMGNSACTVTANAKYDEAPDIYGTCGTCNQYWGADGCQSKDYYTTTSGGKTCSSSEALASISSQNKICCLQNLSKIEEMIETNANEGFDDFSSGSSNTSVGCPSACMSGTTYVYKSPTNGSYYSNVSTSKLASCLGGTLKVPRMSINAIGSIGAIYYLDSSYFKTNDTYCGTAATTTTSWTKDCTSNKGGTTTTIQAGTGISSVSYSGKKRLWLGGEADISATVQSGYVFNGWTISGSGCSVSNSGQTSTKAVGMGCSSSTGCTCSLTANAKDGSTANVTLNSVSSNVGSAVLTVGGNQMARATTGSSVSKTISVNSGTIKAELTCTTGTASISVSGSGCTVSSSNTASTNSTSTLSITGGSSCSISFYCSSSSSSGGGGGGGCDDFDYNSGNGSTLNNSNKNFMQNNTMC